MASFLVTGTPGAGKTSVSAELGRRGLAALDGDDVARWKTPSGVPVDQLERLDAADNADRNEAQRAQILEGRPVVEREGARVLDGRLPTPVLVDEALARVSYASMLEMSPYRSPATASRGTARSSASRSSGVRSTAAAPTFSSR